MKAGTLLKKFDSIQIKNTTAYIEQLIETS